MEKDLSELILEILRNRFDEPSVSYSNHSRLFQIILNYSKLNRAIVILSRLGYNSYL